MLFQHPLLPKVSYRVPLSGSYNSRLGGVCDELRDLTNGNGLTLVSVCLLAYASGDTERDEERTVE
jgi:hypothetical protein